MGQRRQRVYSAWVVPSLYAVTAIAAGLVFPRIESRFFPDLSASVSVPVAMAIYTSIASGMISLTAIVFSLSFVMVQFSATVYSPRLVLWLSRDRFVSHAFGIFTATFLYAIAALAWVDRSGSGKVPFVSPWFVVALLLASMGMFIGLIQRIGLLQINRMLTFTGDQGRQVITKMYSSLESAAPASASDEYRGLPPAETLTHRGQPQTLQAINIPKLLEVAENHKVVIEMAASIGDTVLELTPLLYVYGAHETINECALTDAIDFGTERTFEQDPKYAIRLLVDIAIRALSPAVNDPTTAVQALDQIADLLIRLGHCRLEIGGFRDGAGQLRLIVPFPSWEDFLRLALDEIRFYGATSVQVMRRMKALLSDLCSVLPENRHAALKHWEERLQTSIARSFADVEEKLEALEEDRQGLGIPRRHSTGA
jgi:uncharacterized membrane protein